MPKTMVPFSEWRPDIALLDNDFASEAENVFAGINSYKPIPSLQPFTSAALPGEVCGLYAARTTSGEWNVYAGTRTALFKWTSPGWVDFSRTVGGAYNVAAGDVWQFEQSGTHLVAVQPADNPQVLMDVDAGTHFEDLAGSPPKATNVKQIGDFLVLSGLPATPRVIHWSAVNNITGWTVGSDLSDIQEFADGGPVQGVTGGEIGYVVQERAVRTMQFLPGDTNFIFNFSRVLHDRGCISKYGFTCVGNTLYFVSEDGFYAISGQQVQAIGHDKVDNWWLANSDVANRNLVIAIAGINKPLIVWAFHRVSSNTFYDHLIIFDWSNGRWVHASEQAQVWNLLASLGLDLDTDGTEPGDPLLDSTALPLDSFAYVGGRPLIGAIDEDGFLCALTGPNLPATLETAERHLVPGMRTFVSEAYPLVDGPPETVTAGTRERLQDPITWGTPIPLEITGSAALYSSSRLHRFRVAVPAGSTWTDAQGVVVEAQQDGSVA